MPASTVSMGAAVALSSDGKCKTFDASADGYGRGEAINAIFLKGLVPRTARNKQAAEMGTFEAQSFDDGFVDALLAVFKKFQSGQGQNADRNFEYAYHDQKAYIGRYHRTTANDLPPPSTHSRDARVLAIVVPGSLGTLFWKPVRCRALQDKTVVVDINYSELNFKSILIHSACGGIGLAAIAITAVIDIGVVEGADHLAEHLSGGQRVREAIKWYKNLHETQVSAVELALAQQYSAPDKDPLCNRSQIIVGLSPPEGSNPVHDNKAIYKDPRMKLLLPINSGRRGKEVFQAIRDEIVHRLAPLTNHGVEEICHEQPFTQLGIGSLVVTELRIWLQQTFQIEVTSSEIMSAGRINSLVNLTLKRLKRSCQERMMGWIARKAFKSMGMRWKQQKGSARLFVTRTVVLQSCIYLVNVIRSTFPQSNL
ncbi:hypothetical protein BDV29DRAFT_152501 [Aspergillus leporis]|uniref:Carrier domain-containing protein n=1 Tax=Aspergillus leporis TaxID=41062 RepID=A0A5N5XCW7_9EURO|nr:hypothetical protein BDV29DRAFT_152501 [Aspergillus leporis]